MHNNFRFKTRDFCYHIALSNGSNFFLGESQGWHAQEKIWKLIAGEYLTIFNLTESDLYRMSILMDKYQDTPMDFADASLVAAAENLKTNRIFTLDSDFRVYRINGRESFEIIP